MSKKRFLVTGASGFLGSALVRSLAAKDYSVLAMVRPESDLRRVAEVRSKVEFAYASLDDVSAISKQVVSFAPDVVFHLAWSGGNSRKYVNDPAQVKNVAGSLDLVALAAEARAKAFVFFGSSVEYGRYRVPVSEGDPAEPRNLYGVAKLATMQLTGALCGVLGMRFCGVRPFWTYGPQDDGLRMVPSLIEQLLDGKRPALTKGEQLWDFLYIDDATDALVRLAERDDASGIFNLASGAPIPLRSVIERIRDLIDPDLELGLGDVPYASDQIMHLEASIERLKAATGWEPQVGIEEGLRKTVAWHEAQRLPRQ